MSKKQCKPSGEAVEVVRVMNRVGWKRLGKWFGNIGVWCGLCAFLLVLSSLSGLTLLKAHANAGVNVNSDAASSGLDGELAFQVNGFVFTGNTVFDSNTLTEAVEDAVGMRQTVSDLQSVASRVAAFYRSHGYPVAQAYLPAQEIENGIVEIAVVEGRYGRIALQNSAGLRDQVARAHLGSVQPGAVIERSALNRVTRLLNETPGISARLSLSMGDEPGTSNLTVKLAKGPLWSGSLVVDNFGSEYLGRYRTTLIGALHNPSGWGDRVHVQMMSSGAGLVHGQLAYTGPVNDGPLQLTVTHAVSRYALGGAFTPLNAKGKTEKSSLAARYPYLRAADASIDVGAEYDVRRLEEELFGSDSLRQAQVVTLTTSGARRIDIGLGGADRFSVAVNSGNLQIADPVEAAQDAAAARTAGRYAKLAAELVRQVRLSERWTLSGTLKAQWASKNLHSSEKFALGGAQGIRAYPSGEASGDQGWLTRIEAVLDPQVALDYIRNLRLTGFVDGGSIRFNKQPWQAGENGRTLLGAGIGLHYAPGEHLQAQLEYALPLGAEREENAGGRLLMQVSARW